MSAQDAEDKYKKFDGEGVTFKAKLIGSELVMEPRGDKMCQNSIQRLKAIIKGQKVHKRRIVMKINYSGVKVCDEKTNEILYHHEVPQISFIASDVTDSRTFGYVCDVPNKAHQFVCFKTSGPALQVMSEISNLFEAVLAKKKAKQGEGLDATAAGGGSNAQQQPEDTRTTAETTKSIQNNQTKPGSGQNNDNRYSWLSSITRSAKIDTVSNESAPSSGRSNDNNNYNVKENLKQDTNHGLAFDSSRSFGDDNDANSGELKLLSAATTQPASTTSLLNKGSKCDLDDLKDLHITSGSGSKFDEPTFDLFASGGGSTDAAGDSGIMDLTFNDWLPSPQQDRQRQQQQQFQAGGAGQLPLPPPPPSTGAYHQQRPRSPPPPLFSGSAAIPIANSQRPQMLNFTSSSFSGTRFGGHMLSSTTPTPAMIGSASPVTNTNSKLSGAQNRSLIYNHSSVSLNDEALSNRASAFTSSLMSPQSGFPRQESTDKYAVFNDIDALPSIFESISSLDSASKLSNAGQHLHPGSQSMDNRQHQAHRRQQFSSSTNATNQQYRQSSPSGGGTPRQMNPFDDDFFA